MVLLDSPVQGELSLDYLLPPEERYIAFDKEDRRETLERISHYRVFKAAEKYIGKEPAIPVTYLASAQEPPDTGVPAVDRGFIRLRKAYVDRFDPGRLVEVDSPHFMEPAIPARIADELRAVIEAAS